MIERNEQEIKCQYVIQDLSLGGWTFLTGRGGRKSLKVLKVEVSHFKRVFAVCLLKLCLQLTSSESSEERIEKN